MLHSYDGEFKQFGLFTPMTEILLRLEEVTNIKWELLGVTISMMKKMMMNFMDLILMTMMIVTGIPG